MSRLDAVRRRLEEWKERLVDVTRRNRLLYFRPTSGRTLQLEEPGLDEVFLGLYENENSWRVWEPADSDEDATPGQSTLEGVPHEPSSAAERRRRSDEVKLRPLGSRTWSASMAALRSRARSAYEETGLHILHLAIGTLAWREQDTSEEVLSPVILLPVELARKSRRSPYVLSPADEEPALNPALAIQLDREFRITLPPLPDDWETVPPSAYLNQIAAQVQPRGWIVHADAYLALFSFQKLVIYKDLEVNEATIFAHPVIRAMVGEESTVVGGELPDPSTLDYTAHPKESFLVVDADSSQLAALQGIKLGRSIVIQGPPGTGKSQTITNALAEMIAAGKSVLFVSEKMAALEVVRKRLKAAHLEHYCLELHSHKARRREVVNELWRTYIERVEPHAELTEEEFERLVRQRNLLNDYVRALHERREPLGRSVYDVLGELTRLNDTPALTTSVLTSELTPELLAEVADLSGRLARVWPVALEGDFPWQGCTDTEFTVRSRDRWLQILAAARTATASLQEAGKTLARVCRCPAPGSPDAAEWLLETARLLEQSAPLVRHWLTDGGRAEAMQEARHWSDLTDECRRRTHALAQHFRPEFFHLPEGLEESMRTGAAKLEALLGVVLPRLLEHRKAFEEWVGATLAAIPRVERDARQLRSVLGLSERPLSLDETSRLVRVARIVNGPDRPLAVWLESEAWGRVQRGIEDLEAFYGAFNRASRAVLAHYEEAVLALDVEGMVVRFAGPYRSVLRWLRPSYHRDRARLRACRRDHRVPSDPLPDLQRVRTLLRLRGELGPRRAKWVDVLGTFERGADTDFGHARRALRAAQQLVSLLLDDAEVAVISARLAKPVSAEVATLSSALDASLAEHQQLLANAAPALPSGPPPGFTEPVNALSLDQLREWLTDTQQAFRTVAESLDRLSGLAIDARPVGFGVETALASLEELKALRAMERTLREAMPRLEVAFGRYFRGMDTSWAEVTTALEWARRIHDHFRGRAIPEGLLDLVEELPRSFTEREACKTALDQAVARYIGIRRHFDASPCVTDTPGFLKTAEEKARERHEGPARDRGPCSSLRLWAELDEQIVALTARLDDLRDWIDYRQLHEALAAKGLVSLCEALYAIRVPPEEVVRATRRALFQGWYEQRLSQVPVLARFRGEDHEALIAQFRKLDRRHWEVGSHRVIKAANATRPRHDHIEPTGEVATLRREYNKMRRHLPVRQLIERIPTLLPRLKPVIMMSPISVSQFLLGRLSFDLVIFDEASQIFPEDSVGSVYRAKQVVVCGDSKQLPPTDFFRTDAFDELDEEESAAEATDVFQSVLEELAASGLPNSMLRWHYRSRHESLIAFSNAQFYDYRLITFPSSQKTSDTLGIRFEHVPDGVYDRGRTRTNRREAEKVAELVLNHFQRWPERTLGVVAFSESQRDAIMQALERLADRYPELDRRLAEDDRLDGFFVKNLENVQGDERDVMIFSVGYGRDAIGHMGMNFGPLNWPGGERRLNVAITRAREQVILVSSIWARDIDLARTRAAGALLLRAYLDYAERGEVALELPPEISRGDPESPLEEDVAASVRAMGYQVVHQVGCNRFRIDMGVLDPEEPGRFVLGIECDGATYHSAATARDRDRLRQEVLTRLGWTIHRIWSPDWLMRRAREIERLRSAIEAARTHRRAAPRVDESPPKPPAEEPTVRTLPSAEDDDERLPPEVEFYETVPLAPVTLRAPDFHDPGNQPTIWALVEEVVRKEGPIHRDLVTRRVLEACGVRRLGTRVEDAMQQAFTATLRAGTIRQEEQFLYSSGPDRASRVRAPKPGQEETGREISQIPLDEIQLAMEIILKYAGSLDADVLTRRTARIFGITRLSDNIRDRLTAALDRGTQQGRIRVNGRILTLME